MKCYFIILLMLFTGCATRNKNTVTERDFDRIVLAENISLFGELKIDSTVVSKNVFMLLYKANDLSYVSTGGGKRNRYAVIRTLTKVNDTTNMLTWNTGGTHAVQDTMILTSNLYYQKKVEWCGSPAVVRYETYSFTRKHLVRSEISLFPGQEYFNESIQNRITRQPSIKQDTLYKYGNIESEKMNFLRQHVFSYYFR